MVRPGRDSATVPTPPPPPLLFPEGPRWRDGRFWVSDQLGHHVWTFGPSGGERRPEIDVPRPSGIGFLPGGEMLVASMQEPRVARISAGRVSEWVDLGSYGAHLNDLVVDRRGRAYLDVYDNLRGADARLVLLEGDRSRVVADGLAFPNGVAVTPDGTTLVVSETFGGRITAFDVEADGSLARRRVWAEVEGMTPDGLCLDAAGHVWVASYRAGEFLCLAAGGAVLDRVRLEGRWALACALGGPDGRTLLLCSAEADLDGYLRGESVGFVETRRVEVPGVGCP